MAVSRGRQDNQGTGSFLAFFPGVTINPGDLIVVFTMVKEGSVTINTGGYISLNSFASSGRAANTYNQGDLTISAYYKVATAADIALGGVNVTVAGQFGNINIQTFARTVDHSTWRIVGGGANEHILSGTMHTAYLGYIDWPAKLTPYDNQGIAFAYACNNELADRSPSSASISTNNGSTPGMTDGVYSRTFSGTTAELAWGSAFVIPDEDVETNATFVFNFTTAAWALTDLYVMSAVGFMEMPPIQFQEPGSSGAGTTSISVPFYGATADGDLQLISVSNKYSPNGPSTPAGWNLLAQHTNGTGTGVDQGSVICTVFYKEFVAGDSTANVTISVPSGNTAIGQSFLLKKTDPAAKWKLSFTTGSGSGSSSKLALTSSTPPSAKAGDQLIMFAAVNTDANVGLSDTAFTTDGGATYGPVGPTAINSYPSNNPSYPMAVNYPIGTANGQDCGLSVGAAQIISGVPSSNGPTFTLSDQQLNLAGTARGAAVFVVARAEPPAGNYDPHGMLGFFGM